MLGAPNKKPPAQGRRHQIKKDKRELLRFADNTLSVFVACDIAPRPDRSPEAVAKRKKATDQARAANMRQGYVHDPLLEAATAAYVAGEISRDEYKARVVRKPQ